MNKIENTFNFDSDLNFDADLDLSPIDFSMDESAQNAESKNDSAPSTVELTDEIKSFRQKNHEFQATNDHETYLIVCFSCKEDKVNFLKTVNLSNNHTLVDGYELARNINIEPARPAFKLRDPLSK